MTMHIHAHGLVLGLHGSMLVPEEGFAYSVGSKTTLSGMLIMMM